MMTEAEVQKKIYTPEEYLQLEEKAEYKSEYHDGEILAMSGSTLKHSQLCANVIASLHKILLNNKCRVFDSNLKVFMEINNRYVYPDALVLCEKADYASQNKHAVKNPILIVEVLSDSTESYDRGDKFQKYRTLASFREYVLISQDKIQVEVFFKQDEKQWLYTIYQNIDDVIHLESLTIEVFMKDIYQKIDWEEEVG